MVRGIDGDYVDKSRLQIAPECFTAADLTRPLVLNERYDLALCLEVAEHLDPASGAGLVHALTALAPVVLFSAAVPGQGGIGHVNEQWPEYWRRQFEERGFRMVDVIRPLIRDDCRVEWWYRQNIVMFAAQAAIASNPKLRESPKDDVALQWIHVNMLRPPHAGVRNILVHLKPVLSRAIRKRLP